MTSYLKICENIVKNGLKNIFNSICLIILSILIYFIIIFIQYENKSYLKYFHKKIDSQSNISQKHDIESSVMLIYVYANSHKYAYGNLKFFIDQAVREGDGVDYYFILQQIDNKIINESEMPRLPKGGNAHYIQHENKCFDYGTIGWFFDHYTEGNPWKRTSSSTTNKINLKKYKYFIFLNSSVRGPYLSPYLFQFLLDYKEDFNKLFYWYEIFTKYINEKVKLIGCTIVCYLVPHVQSYFLVTDFIGLTILLKPGSQGGTQHGIFACYLTKADTIQNAELSMSNRILESGYMIQSLVTQEQNINFYKYYQNRCTNVKYPGINWATIEPYEVIFVKYKDREDGQIPHHRAYLYQKWSENINQFNKSF